MSVSPVRQARLTSVTPPRKSVVRGRRKSRSLSPYQKRQNITRRRSPSYSSRSPTPRGNRSQFAKSKRNYSRSPSRSASPPRRENNGRRYSLSRSPPPRRILARKGLRSRSPPPYRRDRDDSYSRSPPPRARRRNTSSPESIAPRRKRYDSSSGSRSPPGRDGPSDTKRNGNGRRVSPGPVRRRSPSYEAAGSGNGKSGRARAADYL